MSGELNHRRASPATAAKHDRADPSRMQANEQVLRSSEHWPKLASEQPNPSTPLHHPAPIRQVRFRPYASNPQWAAPYYRQRSRSRSPSRDQQASRYTPVKQEYEPTSPPPSPGVPTYNPIPSGYSRTSPSRSPSPFVGLGSPRQVWTSSTLRHILTSPRYRHRSPTPYRAQAQSPAYTPESPIQATASLTWAPTPAYSPTSPPPGPSNLSLLYTAGSPAPAPAPPHKATEYLHDEIRDLHFQLMVAKAHIADLEEHLADKEVGLKHYIARAENIRDDAADMVQRMQQQRSDERETEREFGGVNHLLGDQAAVHPSMYGQMEMGLPEELRWPHYPTREY